MEREGSMVNRDTVGPSLTLKGTFSPRGGRKDPRAKAVWWGQLPYLGSKR
jgi:hypothetical protein